ncbi:hypothetical protein J2W35_001258 [Variovorax boronicumulans]|uniref:chromosome partitioning protein ParB n=1 Tax=Variovorax boronicumulans TaxID=436515 RepID=UPI002785E465|nr:chromosome partitioning protein ParB [Variovorax boronicumulans]MDQ0080921.1 hypothetical protein [Variovorax boronicumulans]
MTSRATSAPPKRAPIGRRPAADAASVWVRRADEPTAAPKASIYTARLTVDVTPALRGRIKIEAFKRSTTAAEMLREVLEREYPEDAP